MYFYWQTDYIYLKQAIFTYFTYLFIHLFFFIKLPKVAKLNIRAYIEKVVLAFMIPSLYKI